MPRKPKQKQVKKIQGEAKEKITSPEKKQQKKKVSLQKTIQQLPRVIPKKAEQTPIKKQVHHIEPKFIGVMLFIFGILFVLMMSSAVALGFGSSVKRAVTKTVATFTNNITSIEDAQKTDGKVEALNGERYDPGAMFYPVAIMFDNHSLARPQSHLQNASLVYETLVEGSITRFMGIFDHGDLDKIGPVRSARPYFVQWADALDAAYMHAGGSPEALLKIRQYDIKDITAGQYYYRDYNRTGPHNLYTDSDKIRFALRDYAWTDSAQNYSRWLFNDDPEVGTNDTGESVDLHFSGSAWGSLVRWEYVPDTERYKRFQAGVSHEDTSSGAQLTAKTIVVQVIPPIVSIGDKGRLTLDIVGEGTAYVLFNGKRIEGTWKKSDLTSRTTFYDENGDEVIFPRGNMFVEVIPSDRDVVFK